MSHFPYKSGDWLAICDQCGRRAYASELTKRHDGLMVHKAAEKGCFETRHPQEFVRTVKDNPKLPFTRPEPTDIDLEVTISSAVENAAYNQIPAGTFGNYDP